MIMKRFVILLLILLFVACEPPVPKDKIGHFNLGPLSQEESIEIAKAETIGKEIFQNDHAAARATDVLLSQSVDFSSQPIKGWIVVSDNEGYLVRFINETQHGIEPAFDVKIDYRDKGKLQEKPLGPLSNEQKAMFLARQNALKSAPSLCSDKYNTVVLPDPDSDGWLIYVLAATEEPDKIMVGGHSRVKVSNDGKKVISVNELSKSCLSMNKPKFHEGKEPTAFIVTHLISETPVETHVYLNYLHGYDMYVATRTRNWYISNGKISVPKPY